MITTAAINSNATQQEIMKIRLFIASFEFGLVALVGIKAQGQFAYVATNNAVTITGYLGPGGAVAVPDAIDGLPVVAIGDRAFSGCTSLTGVDVAKSVRVIGAEAFEGCTNLQNVFLSDGVIVIGEGSFADCAGLTSVIIPDTVLTLPNRLYSYSIEDRGVVFRWGRGAFEFCTGLTNLSLGSGVTNIGAYSFRNCPNLLRVSIGPAVVTIGEQAFGMCTGLQDLIIPTGVTRIGPGAFVGCSSLVALDIPDSVTSITSLSATRGLRQPPTIIGAFQGCIGLTDVRIGTNITFIDFGTFNGCTSLSNLSLPDSVTNIGSFAFCKAGFITLSLSDHVVTIGDSAFELCQNLTTVTMGDGITNLARGAFDSCTNLEKVYFRGNAPSCPGGFPFSACDKAIIYFLPGTVGWERNEAGRPTAPWTLPYPIILLRSPSFGVQSNTFGFIVSWATNLSVVMEACTSLSEPVWSAVQTNPLVHPVQTNATFENGWSYFTDVAWTNSPSRYYRVRQL